MIRKCWIFTSRGRFSFQMIVRGFSSFATYISRVSRNLSRGLPNISRGRLDIL
ncbi:hypothetical protein ZOSMA_97G00360 [Zostera marina]|uniref:Uncharacterized protein n=1 Tax=Zostera marina TaxID=29655 RepID=A0A0K9NHN8_ZOSMR|nr:hypothetical protein ZOSMA_97G00360 [Zostera marina]